MKSLLLISLIFLSLAGCEQKPEPTEEEAPNPVPQSAAPGQKGGPSAEMVAALQKELQKESQALDGARVVINGAWNYTGFSFLSPDPMAKIPARLIAVDVTIAGHTPNFDVNDVEVVDGVTNFSYGNNPHFAYLDVQTGKLLPVNEPPAAPKPTRLLLIYGFPKATSSVKLAYWDKIQTKTAAEIAPSGWEIPHPPAQ